MGAEPTRAEGSNPTRGRPVGTEIFERLAPKPSAVPAARAALAPLEAVVEPATLETLRVLVSELVTNSVRHGGSGGASEIGLSVRASPKSVQVEVSDGGFGFEYAPNESTPLQEGGWGLRLVEAFSDRWGIHSG